MANKGKKAPVGPEDQDVVKREADSRADKPSSAGAQTNSQVKSGGNEDDDLVDEQSKESFPSSDAPGNY